MTIAQIFQLSILEKTEKELTILWSPPNQCSEFPVSIYTEIILQVSSSFYLLYIFQKRELKERLPATMHIE